MHIFHSRSLPYYLHSYGVDSAAKIFAGSTLMGGGDIRQMPHLGKNVPNDVLSLPDDFYCYTDWTAYWMNSLYYSASLYLLTICTGVLHCLTVAAC
jgi:hypothetical protein